MPENTILVSGSGVETGEDIRLLGSFGADAVLDGSSMMGSPNISGKVNELVKAGKGEGLD